MEIINDDFYQDLKRLEKELIGGKNENSTKQQK